MNSRMIALIAAAIAVVCQIFLAPIIQVNSVVPNILLVFVIVLAIIRPPDSTYIYAFVLGLISDLLANMPVGLSSLLLLIACFALPRVFHVLDDSSPVMPIVAIASVVLVIGLVEMIVMLVLGYPASFFELLGGRVLPGFIYNSIVGAAVYFLCRKFVPEEAGSDAWMISESQRYR